MPAPLKKIKKEMTGKEVERKTKDYPILRVKDIETRLTPGIKAIAYRGIVESETGRLDYLTTVQFFKIDFSKKRTEDTPVEGKMGRKKFFHEKPQIKRHQVKLKCTCFPGDTLIPLASGEVLPIKDLVGREKFQVYAFDEEENKFVISNAYGCEIKEKNSELVEIEIDTGTKIRCTPDHVLRLKSGDWIKAEDLQSGDSLTPMYKRVNEGVLEAYCGEKWKKVTTSNSPGQFYTYVYLNPNSSGKFKCGSYEFSHEPIYVGKGKGRRFHQYKNQNYQFQKLLRLNNREFFVPLIFLIENISEGYAYYLERNLIQSIGRLDIGTGPLLNKCDGGLGTVNPDERNRGLSSRRMKKLNPMKLDDAKEKMIQTSRERGYYDSDRMAKVSSNRTSESFKRIGRAQRRLIDEGKHVGLNAMIQITRDAVEQGKHHFQTEKHRLQTSDIQRIKVEAGRHQFQDKEFRKSVSIRGKRILLNPQEQEKRIVSRALSAIKRNLKQNDGHFVESNFVSGTGFPSLKTIKAKYDLFGLVKGAESELYYNHKVVSVKRLEQREDVYCFTVEKYGNVILGKGDNSLILFRNCPDFRFMFEKELHDNKALIGGFRRYKRLTPPPVRPANPTNPNPIGHDFKNPNNLMGFCKHVWSLLNSLNRTGTIGG